MFENKLRVGVIGVGGWATISHIPGLRKTGQAEVVAICRRNPQRLAHLKGELGVERADTDWRQMLDEVGARRGSGEYAARCAHRPDAGCARAGPACVVEKPMALTSEDARAVVAAAEKAGGVRRSAITLGATRSFERPATGSRKD